MKLANALPTIADKLSGLFDAPHVALGLLFIRLHSRNKNASADLFGVTDHWTTLQHSKHDANLGNHINEIMCDLESTNPVLTGKLFKGFDSAEFTHDLLGAVIDIIKDIDLSETTDALGESYEFFLGQFAATEGRKGGQFYTPRSIVELLVSIIAPSNGSVYDPCCGSGGMFIQSDKFVKENDYGDIQVFGQEVNPTTWRLTAMNLALKGFEVDLGSIPASTLTDDQFPTRKFDYILANPPFNVSNWYAEGYESDSRWSYGVPSRGNSNFAWLQHVLGKLAPNGRAGVVMANSSLSTESKDEKAIRERMIKDGVVEAIIALPSKLFTNTQIPVCIWIMTKNNKNHGKVLFIDGREKLGKMTSRTLRVLTNDDVNKVYLTFERWRFGEWDEGEDEFSGAADINEIERHNFTLTPGRYIKLETLETDDVPFDTKITELVKEYRSLKVEGDVLDRKIERSLESILENVGDGGLR